MAGSGVGAFAFAPFIQFLIKRSDWKMTMIILGGILFLCCILGAFLKPAPRVSINQKKLAKL